MAKKPKEFNKLAQDVTHYLLASFPGIWVESYDAEEVINTVEAIAKKFKWTVLRWDCSEGLRADFTPLLEAPKEMGQGPAAGMPLPQVFRSVMAYRQEIQEQGVDSNPRMLLIMENLHRQWNRPENVQAVLTALRKFKAAMSNIIVISPIVDLPPEIEKRFALIEHPLPDLTERHQVFTDTFKEYVAVNSGAHEEEFMAAMEAAAGLTRTEAEDAFSLSMVKNDWHVVSKTVWDYKIQMVKKQGLLSIFRGQETFADIGGLEAVKDFCLKAINTRSPIAEARPKGIVLLGIAGCGKSALAKALGTEVNRPTVVMNIGDLMGGLVGQTEANVKRALQVVDACAPCVLFVDELEKSLSGAQNSGQTDSGVTSRLFGTLLTWLQDHTSDVFFVGTCNSIENIPDAFMRAERFDAVYFVDFPSPAQQKQIWEIYLKKFQLDPSQKRPNSQNWTGAEIKSCCRTAAMLGVSLVEASKKIIAISERSTESTQNLRSWAAERCLCAETGEAFRVERKASPTPTKPGRNLIVNPTVKS